MRKIITLLIEDDRSQCTLFGKKEPVSFLTYEEAKEFIDVNNLRFDRHHPAGFEVWTDEN